MPDTTPTSPAPSITPGAVSWFSRADENLPEKDISPAEFIEPIRKGVFRGKVQEIRDRFNRALTRTNGNRKAAKKTVDGLKKRLPAVTFSGVFGTRAKDQLQQHSGLLQADIDLLGDRLPALREQLKYDAHVWALFVSPTGDGLKAIYRVPVCATAKEHEIAHTAVASHVKKLYGVDIDATIDVSRLCYTSFDPDAFANPEAIALPVNFDQPEVPPPQATNSAPLDRPVANLSERQRITEQVCGPVSWETSTSGYCECAGKSRHTNADGPKDCKVMIDGAPTIKCMHTSCAAVVEGVNHTLRSRIAKAEWRPASGEAKRNEYLPSDSEAAQKPKVEDGLPEIDNATGLLADETIVLPPEIIEGILHQTLKGVLGSGSKARKTWILLDIGICIATGLPWWNRRTIKGKVLYINFEIPRPFIRSRIKRLCEAKGIAGADLSNMDVWTLRGHAAALGTLLPSLFAKIETGKYSIIIIDPIYKGLGGREENAAGDISEVCNELERLAVKTGAAVLIAAHFSKGNQAGKESIDRISGSGVWGRDPDSIITLTKHKTEGAYTVDLTLRNLPEQPPFVVAWKFPLMSIAEELNPADLKQPGGRKQEHDEKDLLRVLPAAGLSTTKWQEKAEKEEGISSRSFYRLKKSLEAAGRVLHSKVNGRWQPLKKVTATIPPEE